MLQRQISAVVLASMLSACAASLPAPREYLDEKTAATISVADKPLVFAHERPELAVHSREYVTLVAVVVNRTGAVDDYLFAYSWSTVDRRDTGTSAATDDAMTIVADDRQLRLEPAAQSPEEVSVGEPPGAPPGHRWTLHVYHTDLATLHFLAESRQIAVVTRSSEGPLTYELWSDQRSALRGLVQRLEGF